ncbi:MAG: response regulator [Candidatus Rokubacteria bacterium]|nr:response regulator [Candidatus Rokubacteria bacterium]
MQVVVVDDELPVMQLCARVLELGGYRVDGFTRAEEALVRLSTAPADLLVVDYRMPGVSGLEVARRARAARPGLPVMLITGHGSPDVLAEAAAAGVDRVLLKPFTPNELIEAAAALAAPGADGR